MFRYETLDGLSLLIDELLPQSIQRNGPKRNLSYIKISEYKHNNLHKIMLIINLKTENKRKNNAHKLK